MEDSPSPPSGPARQSSFSSIRSRIRKSSLTSKRKSIANEDDSVYAANGPDAAKRWSTHSEQSAPPLPPRAVKAPAAGPNGVEPYSITRNESYQEPPKSPGRVPPGSVDGRDKRDATEAKGFVSGLAQSAQKLTSGGAARATGAGPLQEHISTILLFFAGTCLAVLVLSHVHWLLAVVVAGCSIHTLWQKLEIAGRDAKWEFEMAEAAKHFQNPEQHGETVEWLNSTLATVWPLIGSDYFAPFVDLLEDSLMTKVPGIVHSVRVENMDQGTIPIRVKSFKVIPSDEASFLAAESTSTSRSRRKRDSAVGSDFGDTALGESEVDKDNGIDSGNYINLEVTFAYRATRPKRGRFSSKFTTTNTNTTSNGDKPDSSEPIGGDAGPSDDTAYPTLSETPTEMIHMLIYMSIGLPKIAAVEVPVWIEMIGIEGKMRVRLQLTPVAPFVKHAAITFVGSPKLEMSAKPLGRKMVIDAMNLPLISSYALHSVEDVIKGFIAPKSYTVDVAGLLGASEGPQDVYAVGLIVLVIHQATDLAAADTNGWSDPFVQASLSHAGKPLFTSRVLRKTIDPVWQETAFLLVSPDELRDHERLRLTVLDADRFSADDPLGKVDISIDGLIRSSMHRNGNDADKLLETRMDDLKPMRRGSSVQGRLKYSIGFFALAHGQDTNMNPRRQQLLAKAEERSKSDSTRSRDFAACSGPSPPSLPPKPGQGLKVVTGAAPSPPSQEASAGTDDQDLHHFTTPFDRFIRSLGVPLDDDVLIKRRERKGRVQKLTTMIEGAKLATAEPPRRELPSGLLTFHIHSIYNLEVQQTQRSYSNSKRLSPKQRYSTNAEKTLAEGSGAGKLPSSYVQVFLNDEAVFRTRTKTLNPRPYINGGSERYVGDWTTARIDFTVRDARMREGDPILGCVALKLADVLKQSSRSTEWYTLTGGLGHGKIRITLVWRSFQVSIPKPLRGWNVGVIELSSCRAFGLSQQLFELKPCHVLFETVGGKVETSNVEPTEGKPSNPGGGGNTLAYHWSLEQTSVRVPVRQRYPNFLYVHLRSDSRVPGRHHKHAHAVVPLNRISDDTFTKYRIPLFETSDMDRFEQDMLKVTTDSEQLLSPVPEQDEQPRFSAVLEDLSHSIIRDLPEEVSSDNHIKRVGWLELGLIYHRGIAQEHRSCVAGDHEMRFAYETYVTLTDCGERAKSNTLNAESRRRLGLQVGRQTGNANGDGVGESGQPSVAANTTHRRNPSDPEGAETSAADADESEVRTWKKELADDGQVHDIDRDSLYAESVTDSELGDYMEDPDADLNTPEGRRARQRALHRQHLGAAQVKGFRTLTWLKTNAEDGVGRVKRQFDKQSKRIGKMESEGVSHF